MKKKLSQWPDFVEKPSLINFFAEFNDGRAKGVLICYTVLVGAIKQKISTITRFVFTVPLDKEDAPAATTE